MAFWKQIFSKSKQKQRIKQAPKLPERTRMFKENIMLDAFVNNFVFMVGRWFHNIRRAMRTASHYMRVNFWWRQFFHLFSFGFNCAAIGFIAMSILAAPALKVGQKNLINPPEISAIFYDRAGNEIGRRGAWRTNRVPIEEMPDYFIQAVLATEDRRFFEHYGIDPLGLARAMITNVKAQAVVQGGSSLTQQLAKNLYLTSERSFERKINEAFLSLWLEARFSKKEILRLYFDRTYMASGVVGVDAAAEYYFGKSIKDVSLAEAAILAGMFKAPTKYAPTINLPLARARANEVLSNLVEAGYLTEGQVFAARRNPARAIAREKGAQSSTDYFLDTAFEELQQILPVGHSAVKVFTTLDSQFQRIADDVMKTSFREFSSNYNFDEGALLGASKTGEIRAIVGGRDYSQSQFNRATQALRQPGSAFKPFVYATALMNGYERTSRETDVAIRIGNYVPKNYYSGSKGRVTLESALAISINTIPVKLTHYLGRQKVADMARDLGISTPIQVKYNPSLPLGSTEVTVHDMVEAYSVFLNEGIKKPLYTISFIEDMNGEPVYNRAEEETEQTRILDEYVARDLNIMLNSVIYRGTARRAQIEGLPTAGKTGTTTSYKDGWFVGFSGDMVTGVWFGNDSTKPTNKISGGNVPAITWQRFMSRSHEQMAVWQEIPGVNFPSQRPPVEFSVAQSEQKLNNDITLAQEAIDPSLLYQNLLSPKMAKILRNIQNQFKNIRQADLNDDMQLGYLNE